MDYENYISEIEYKLLYNDMNKTEYKKLIEEYMNKYKLFYMGALQKIRDDRVKQIYKDYRSYGEDYVKLLMGTRNEIIENGYNISML